MNMDSLARAYVKMRETKRAIEADAEKKAAEIEEKMKMVAAAMKDMLVEVGGTSMKTAHGMVYLTTKTRYYAQDWAAFSAYVLQHQALNLVERRVAQREMAEWLESHPTDPPTGVHADSETTVVVRKQ